MIKQIKHTTTVIVVVDRRRKTDDTADIKSIDKQSFDINNW